MPGLPSEVDVAVIGAGAAGIAAGRRLAEAKRASFVVIEARERAGGRAWTVETDGLAARSGVRMAAFGGSQSAGANAEKIELT